MSPGREPHQREGSTAPRPLGSPGEQGLAPPWGWMREGKGEGGPTLSPGTTAPWQQAVGIVRNKQKSQTKNIFEGMRSADKMPLCSKAHAEARGLLPRSWALPPPRLHTLGLAKFKVEVPLCVQGGSVLGSRVCRKRWAGLGQAVTPLTPRENKRCLLVLCGSCPVFCLSLQLHLLPPL